MRIVYVLLTYLLAPFVIAVEGWRTLTNPEYRGRLHQRLGFVKPQAAPGCIWVHAVSVGEVQAAAGIIRELRRRLPDVEVVCTTVTPTGAQRVRALFGNEVRHCYLPYHQLGRRGIPLVMASARVSTRSVDRYRRMASLFRETLSHGIVIGAQSAADAERFRAIGAAPERVRVTGNVKFDLEVPRSAMQVGHEFRAALGAGRPVWIAGSTHEGEEEAALAAHGIVRSRHPSALLILVPRHPQRFDAVRNLLRKRGHAANCRRSTPRPTSPSSAGASCRSAGTTCSSPRCSGCRCCPGRTPTTHRTSPNCSPSPGRSGSCGAGRTWRSAWATSSTTLSARAATAHAARRSSLRVEAPSAASSRWCCRSSAGRAGLLQGRRLGERVVDGAEVGRHQHA